MALEMKPFGNIVGKGENISRNGATLQCHL